MAVTSESVGAWLVVRHSAHKAPQCRTRGDVTKRDLTVQLTWVTVAHGHKLEHNYVLSMATEGGGPRHIYACLRSEHPLRAAVVFARACAAVKLAKAAPAPRHPPEI